MRIALFAFALLIGLTGCSGVPIGPVDHGCINHPEIAEGSGCCHGGH